MFNVRCGTESHPYNPETTKACTDIVSSTFDKRPVRESQKNHAWQYSVVGSARQQIQLDVRGGAELVVGVLHPRRYPNPTRTRQCRCVRVRAVTQLPCKGICLDNHTRCESPRTPASAKVLT